MDPVIAVDHNDPAPKIFHKPAAPVMSTGADSAIFVNEDGKQSLYSGSSRSSSRSTSIENAAKEKPEPPGQELGGNASPESTQKIEEELHRGQQLVNPNGHHGSVVTLGAPVNDPHLHQMDSSQTCPSLIRHPLSNPILVPLHRPVTCSVPCISPHPVAVGQQVLRNDPGNPYYVTQGRNGTMSAASSRLCFSPHQLGDPHHRQEPTNLIPAGSRIQLFKTDSGNGSIVYGMGPGGSKQNLHRSESEEPKSLRRKQVFLRLLTTKLSAVYAVFVIVLGVILYISDVLGTVGHSYVEVFQVYLFMVAITFYIFIHIDVRRFLKSESLKERHEELVASGLLPSTFAHSLFDDERNDRRKNFSSDGSPKVKPYGFKTGRHAGCLYLKLGAVAFCFGSMIHDGLVLSKRLDIVVTQLYSSCMNIIDLFTPALNLVFSFYQLYFIFKHYNIVINRYQEVARFGAIHSLAVNLCVWFRTLVDETIDEFSRKYAIESSADAARDTTTSHVSDVLKHMAEDAAWHGPAPVATANNFRALDLNHTTAALTACMPDTVLANIAQEAAPYLYPFTIEYTFIAAAVWYLIWSKIGEDHVEPPNKQSHPPTPHQSFSSLHSHSQDPVVHKETHAEGRSALYMIHVDCRSTSKGLFSGIFILVATVISIIIFFVTVSAEEYTSTGIIVNHVSELSLYVLTGFATAFAYCKTYKLDLNQHALGFTIDDLMLFVPLPFFFVYSLFSILAGIAAYNPLSIIVNTAAMFQVILQTVFIYDGLRRCSNSTELQRKKPGRELITFLIVCNVALWTFSTLEIKRAETNPSQMQFYGEFEWSIISHFSVPLTIFYRFHSSVCLVDIWRWAYQPGEGH